MTTEFFNNTPGARVLVQALRLPAQAVVSGHSGLVQPDVNGYAVVDIRDVAVMASYGFIVAPVYVSDSDPTTSHDNSFGFRIGSIWYNVDAARTWLCVDNSAQSAQWNFIYAPTSV